MGSLVKSMISDQNSLADVVVNPQKAETKSARANFLLKPSVYKALKAKCKKRGISVNEAVNQLIESWIEVE